MNNEEKYYSIPQVMEKIGLSRETIYRHIKRNKLQVFKVGRQLRVSESQFQEYVTGKNTSQIHTPLVQDEPIIA